MVLLRFILTGHNNATPVGTTLGAEIIPPIRLRGRQFKKYLLWFPAATHNSFCPIHTGAAKKKLK